MRNISKLGVMLNASGNLNFMEKRIMKIGVIQASSQTNKNKILYDITKQCAKGNEIINFGCFADEENRYSYIEISIEIGLLLMSGAVDFIVTGCSSGQGMMLACNSMPGVICGYAPTPMDAYLYVQINNGNAVSLPLGEDYTYSGIENLRQTIEKLFSEPFGQGYPKEDATRKLRDTELLKSIRKNSQVSFVSLMEELDEKLIEQVLKRNNVVNYILTNGSNMDIVDWINKHR